MTSHTDTIKGTGNRRSLFASRGPRSLTAAALAICAFILLPVATLIWIALSSDTATIARLWRDVIPATSLTTSMLMVGVATLTALTGTGAAWLVAFFDFPGRRILSWALVLPLAIPSYLAAYGFVEFASFTGPVQELVREIGGYRSARDYWFPEIRSLGGAIIILSAVLYPYVYLSTRALFTLQGRRITEAAQLLGAGKMRILFKVQVPMARPAIALGVTLALMETINDIGAVEFLGVNTLTFSVYSVWLNQSDLAGASQLALALFAFILGLVLIERHARRNQQYFDRRHSAKAHLFERSQLLGLKGWAATILCALPIAIGFGVPIYVLGGYASRRLAALLDPRLIEALTTSLTVSSLAALITILLGFVLAYWSRLSLDPRQNYFIRIATIGYAIPGTIIALGLFIPMAAFDNAFDSVMRTSFGISTGLLISGSGILIIYAYAVRFLAMAEGTIDAGMKKLPPSLDMAARILGRNNRATITEVLLPLLRPAILTGGLLVFIDSLKELSATILLRPFGFNSLSTYVYEYASRALVEDAAVPAMVIILAGIFPAYLVSRSSA